MKYLKYFYVKMNKLQSLIIFVTNRCNCRCGHCFYWKELNKPTQEMSLEEFNKLFSSLHKLSNVSLTGGEPFLRNDLLDIIKIAHKKTEQLVIPTNGILTNRILSVISKSPISIDVKVSLDGLKDTHDSIRGIDCFNKVVKTIKQVKPIAKSVSVNTVVTNRNYQELKRLNEFVKTLGVKHNFIMVRGDPKNPNMNVPEDLDHVYKTIESIYRDQVGDRFVLNLKLEQLKYTINMIKGEKQRLVRCLAGKHAGVIYPNGDVTICEPFKPFANLRDFDFNFPELWKSKEAGIEREKVKNCHCYHDCFLVPSLTLDLRKFIKFNLM